jgi:CO dehydrogenase nickel-insertion accessory protein CooC1
MTIENFVIQNAIPEQPIQETTLESLRAARALQKMRRSHGVNRVDLIVNDVEGNWLEQWGEEEAVGSKATSEQTQ